MMEIPIALIVISDRASSGERPDETAALLREWCNGNSCILAATRVVPDEPGRITEALHEMFEREDIAVILTSGGTGLSPRDITPDTILPLLDKPTPGIDELLRRRGSEKNRYAVLSRGVSGICRDKFVAALPGNPAAVIESITILQDLLPHAIDVLRQNATDEDHGNHGR